MTRRDTMAAVWADRGFDGRGAGGGGLYPAMGAAGLLVWAAVAMVNWLLPIGGAA